MTMHRLVAALLVALPSVVCAAPTPPCDGDPSPPYGSADGPPQAGSWTSTELRAARWQPSRCLGWTGDSKLVVAVASRFHADDNVFDRVGRVSAWPTVKYWSISKQRWEPLALAAFAIDASQGRQADVRLSDLSPGRESLFVERDANSGETTYRMRVFERSAQRLVIASENATAIKIMLLTAFEPGSLQTVTFVQKEADNVWSTYQITRVGSGASSMALDHAGSFLNRLEAVRRYLAAQPSDRQTPLAPR